MAFSTIAATSASSFFIFSCAISHMLRHAMTVTTGFLMLSAVLSWVVFSQWTWGDLQPFTVTYAPFIHVGQFVSNWATCVAAILSRIGSDRGVVGML